MIEHIKYCYESGQIKQEQYFLNGIMHRVGGPADLHYYESGQIAREYYFINSEYHRFDGPAIIYYDKFGQITVGEYFINDILLENFEKYGKDKIFEYIKIYPQYIRQVSAIVRHNNWLNEEQTLLLETIDVFD